MSALPTPMAPSLLNDRPDLVGLEHCPRSSVDGNALIKIIGSLVDHGDLRNIRHVEQTLGVQLKLASSSLNTTVYRADSVFDLPIQVELYIQTGRTDAHDADTVAFLRLGNRPWPSPDIFSDCLRISADDFTRYWGATFNRTAIPDSSATGSASARLVSPASSHNTLILGYSYGTTDDVVLRITLRQLM